MTKRQKLYLLIPLFLALFNINKCQQSKIENGETILGTRTIQVITDRVKNNLSPATASGMKRDNLTLSSNVARTGDTVFVPAEGKIIIENGRPEIKNYGFTFHPGFDIGVGGAGNFGCGIDTKFIYFEHFGANVGLVGISRLDTLSLATGISYSLAGRGFLLNTELDLKYAPRYIAPVWVGLRWNF